MCGRPHKASIRAVQPDGYPYVRPFDADEWPGETTSDRVLAYARALMPPGPDRFPLATSTLRPWARKRGFGVFAPVPASVPPFAPLLDADGTLHSLRIYAGSWQHALALRFREIAARWIAANPEKVRMEDPPLSDRERFGF